MTPQEMFNKLAADRMNAKEEFREDLEDKAILWAHEAIIHLEADLEMAREKLRQIKEIVAKSPELNMSNFDTDQVAEPLIKVCNILQPDEDGEVI